MVLNMRWQPIKGKERELNARIPAGNALLQGELVVPAGVIGVSLFAHGSGSGRLSPRNQFVAEELRNAGIGTLLFDLLTEEEEAREAYTRHLRFNIPMLAERLLAATTWLAGEQAVQGLGIGYFGSSTGAAAALLAAVELNGRVQAVVSRGGRPDLAGPALGRVTAPTLLLVGELDTEIIRLNQEAFTQLPGEKALEIIPGATHLFEEPGALEAVARLAAEWFQEHLPQGRRGAS